MIQVAVAAYLIHKAIEGLCRSSAAPIAILVIAQHKSAVRLQKAGLLCLSLTNPKTLLMFCSTKQFLLYKTKEGPWHV